MAETIIGDIGDLKLRSGEVLPDAKLAYCTYGTLAPDGRNAILLTHGYTSSHLFADAGPGSSEGSWGDFVGPGLPFDPQQHFIVSTNMIGSSFGSTAPRSVNPATGKPYGPDFPAYTLADIVTAQRHLLDRLGVKGLIAVAGPSYGGFQAFAWAIEFPDFMRGIVAAVTGLRSPRNDIDATTRRLATDPHWNGGHYYETPGGIDATMTALRADTLRTYGIEEALAARFPDPAAREAEIQRQARAWMETFDGHSLIVLGRAANAYDAEPHLSRIKARVLFVLSRTDVLFPPSSAPSTMAALQAAGVDARYAEIDSDQGHLASGLDAKKWLPELRAFMESLA
jgi:homoserine O-acetyltransferase